MLELLLELQVGRLYQYGAIRPDDGRDAAIAFIGLDDELFGCFVMIDIDPPVRDVVLFQELFRPPAIRAPFGGVYGYRVFSHE